MSFSKMFIFTVDKILAPLSVIKKTILCFLIPYSLRSCSNHSQLLAEEWISPSSKTLEVTFSKSNLERFQMYTIIPKKLFIFMVSIQISVVIVIFSTIDNLDLINDNNISY